MRSSIKVNENLSLNNPQITFRISNSNKKPFYYYGHLQRYQHLRSHNSSSIQNLKNLKNREKLKLGVIKEKKQIKQMKSKIQSILKRNNQNMSPLLETYYRSDMRTIGLIDKSTQSRTLQVIEDGHPNHLQTRNYNSSSITSIKKIDQKDKSQIHNSSQLKLGKFYFKKNNPVRIKRQYLLFNSNKIKQKSAQKDNNKLASLSLSTDKYFKLQNCNDFGNRNYINLSSQKNIQKRKSKYAFKSLNIQNNIYQNNHSSLQVQACKQNSKKSLEIFKKILQKNLNSTSKKLLHNNSSRLMGDKSSRLLDHNPTFNDIDNIQQNNQVWQQLLQQQKNINQGSSKIFQVYQRQNYYQTHKLNVKDEQLHTYYQKFYNRKQQDLKNNMPNKSINMQKNRFGYILKDSQIRKDHYQKVKQQSKIQASSPSLNYTTSSELYPFGLKQKMDLAESFKHKKKGYSIQTQQQVCIQAKNTKYNVQNEKIQLQKKQRRKLISIKQPIANKYDYFDPWERTKLYQEEMTAIQIQQKSYNDQYNKI